MKCRTLAAVIAILFMFAVSGTAGKKPVSLNVTLDTSCTSCAYGVGIAYSGSGYPVNTPIFIGVQGPIQVNISTTSDGAGNFYVNYGGAIVYPNGNYTATASDIVHKTVVLLASTTFTVQ